MAKKAVILFSGGLDSTTCLYYALNHGFDCYALSFDYGQRHRAELMAAKKIAQQVQVKKHCIFELNLPQFGGSALTDTAISVPDYQVQTEIPVTYVPARNTIFLSVALAWAETLGAHDIFIGVSCVDYSNYADCRPEYIQAFQDMARLGTKMGIEGDQITIHTPLIHLSKAETIRLGRSLGVDYDQTISCYRADEFGRACGTCDSCYLRQKGFQEVND